MGAKADCGGRGGLQDNVFIFSLDSLRPADSSPSLEDVFSNRGDLALLSFMCVMKACV